MKNVIIILLCCFAAYGCRQSPVKDKNSEIGKRYDQVMMIHDEVMPKMKHLRSLRKNLEKQKREVADVSITSLMDICIRDLENAENDMMTWMAEFKLPTDKTEAEQLAYLQGEQKKMEKLRIETEQALNNGADFSNKKK